MQGLGFLGWRARLLDDAGDTDCIIFCAPLGRDRRSFPDSTSDRCEAPSRIGNKEFEHRLAAIEHARASIVGLSPLDGPVP